MLSNGSTAIAGRSGSGKAACRCWRLSSDGGRSAAATDWSQPDWVRTSPTKRSPLREMVRISFWSWPLSPTALRAA